MSIEKEIFGPDAEGLMFDNEMLRKRIGLWQLIGVAGWLLFLFT